MEPFRDRRDAGKKLAQKLSIYKDRLDVTILALPRGGVPVAYEVAVVLNAPLDILIVRKLGLPGREELAIGAIASGGIRVLNEDIVHVLNIPEELIDSIAQRELQEMQRREQMYRGDRPAPNVHDRTVILVDDGLATGASMRAAVAAVRVQQPARLVIGVPVAAPETCDAFQFNVDEIVCVITPEPLYGVSRWYEDFSQTSDDEVRRLLQEANWQVLGTASST